MSSHCSRCNQKLKRWEIEDHTCEDCIRTREGNSPVELFTDETEFEQDLFYDGLSAERYISAI